MNTHHSKNRVVVAATIVSLVSPPLFEGMNAQTTAPKPAPAGATTTTTTTTTTTQTRTTAAAPAAAAPTPIVDGGWPRERTLKSGANLVVFQPQIESWPDQKHMSILAAVAYTPKGSTKQELGTIKAEADTAVSLETRLVHFTPLQITQPNFPSLAREQVRDLTAEINEAIPDDERVIALDRVLESVDKSQILPKNVDGVKADPPTIFFSKTPAVLMVLDGDPIWSPIRENDLKFAVNTNWDLFSHEPTKTFYLRNNDAWLKATDLKGAWSPAGKLPESFSKLPADANWKDVKDNLPGKSVSAKNVPKVLYSTAPAEMILLRGEPTYLAVQGAGELLWVNNTDSDVFRMGKTGPVYYLVAGRWFSAPDFTGPWTFATTSMPAAFQKIPLEHPRSRVLASVPGTQQAAEAVLLAQVPQTARVNRKELKAPDVEYQGDPQFQAIPKTTVERAVNTDKDIIKVGDLYYMCFQAVWFMSKSATGPWEVATSVPKEIYQIPAESPAHSVTYVIVEDDDDDDDDWTTFAMVAGYTGMMIAWGCAVWGTGWYYPPYAYYGGFYPVYYPHFPTYGYSAWYNPWTGGYGRSAVAYGPYGGVGAGARYNPRTGTYARGAVAWGPYGASGAAQAWNPRTGTYAQTRQGSNVYGSWGSTAVQRGDNWAQTSRVTNNVTGNTTRVTQGSGGGTAISRNAAGPGGGTVARTGSGDIYAGQDGNVYRRNDAGGWQKYENGGWGDVQTPQGGDRAAQARDRATTAQQNGVGSGAAADRAGTAQQNRAGAASTGTRTMDSGTAGQLQRDGAARTSGSQRTGDLGSYRSSGGSSGASRGSYRPSGGARAGGGGRRR
jgi:hypothetical protein